MYPRKVTNDGIFANIGAHTCFIEKENFHIDILLCTHIPFVIPPIPGEDVPTKPRYLTSLSHNHPLDSKSSLCRNIASALTQDHGAGTTKIPWMHCCDATYV